MSQIDDAIYHIALPDDWNAAKEQGAYAHSTRDRTLDEVGFVHCSYPSQLAKVANFAYADVAELMVLEIDPELMDVEVKVEPGDPGSDEVFPHVYGPIPTMAVINNFWWERGEDGIWHRPPCLS